MLPSSMVVEMEQGRPHFLVVSFPAPGHANPALHLARRLAHTTGTHVTFFTAISARRRMSPSSSPRGEEVEDGLMTYNFFSDGYDEGFKAETDSSSDFMTQFKRAGSQKLAALVRSLAASGRPVTCLIHTLLLTWVADVARDLGIPSALYWIQPATVLAIYYHYFHGYEHLVSAHRNDPLFTVNLPGLSPLQIKDIPSFLTISTHDDPYSHVLSSFRELFEVMDRATASGKRPRVLVNTFDALEPNGLAAIDGFDLTTIGPLLPPSFPESKGCLKDIDSRLGLMTLDEKYMKWMDSKPSGSVVYISFGSFSLFKKQELDEISRALAESGRPYLWVVRKDNRGEGVVLQEDGEKGVVVEWCSQLRVLSHPSLGCFVTHCGWNSMLESLACGVPTLCVPQWTDQVTNARLAETVWGTGVRVEVNADGVLEGTELLRCLDVVMGDGERGLEIRRRATTWRNRALEAIREGGSSDRNLRAFAAEITKWNQVMEIGN